jgi:hypothetical protein
MYVNLHYVLILKTVYVRIEKPEKKDEEVIPRFSGVNDWNFISQLRLFQN